MGVTASLAGRGTRTFEIDLVSVGRAAVPAIDARASAARAYR